MFWESIIDSVTAVSFSWRHHTQNNNHFMMMSIYNSVSTLFSRLLPWLFRWKSTDAWDACLISQTLKIICDKRLLICFLWIWERTLCFIIAFAFSAFRKNLIFLWNVMCEIKENKYQENCLFFIKNIIYSYLEKCNTFIFQCLTNIKTYVHSGSSFHSIKLMLLFLITWLTDKTIWWFNN